MNWDMPIACAMSAQRLLPDKWAFKVALFAKFLLARIINWENHTIPGFVRTVYPNLVDARSTKAFPIWARVLLPS